MNASKLPKTIVGLLFKADGKWEVVNVPTGEKQCDFLQNLVGGWIEVITMYPKDANGAEVAVCAYVNEEGKIMGLPYNKAATNFWYSTYANRGVHLGSDYLAGDVVFLEDVDENGEHTADLPASFIASALV
jgi:hypothetical protein